MNEHFVCIKVDREERPDLDQIYMNAVQMMTGRGGWPMSVFLTPELQAVLWRHLLAADRSRWACPASTRCSSAVADAWQNRRAIARVEQADALTEHLQSIRPRPPGAAGDLDSDLLDNAAARRSRAPSIPRTAASAGAQVSAPDGSATAAACCGIASRANRLLHMVTLTLDKMAAGGIYDQLGGGFHRYSVDERWLVPHFEKMLYDNALLMPRPISRHIWPPANADSPASPARPATTCCAR